MIYEAATGLRLLGPGVFLEGGAQLEIAHQAMEIVGVDAEASCGVSDTSAGLVESGHDELLFQVADGVVIFSG